MRASSIVSLPPQQREAWLASLSETELEALDYDWKFWGRDDQLSPAGLWRIWLIKSGRGNGKTRTGAEWVRERAEMGGKRIALIGRTGTDVRGTMVEGESGILARSPPWFRPQWEPSVGPEGTLTWPNGSTAICFSGEVPDALRGPQFTDGWLDELAAMRRAQAVWDMYRFALRLGNDPRTLVTTTPRPIGIIKALVSDKRVAPDGSPLVRVTTGSTYDNVGNLADDFFAEMISKYEGTRLGRQELRGEILADIPGALWTIGNIDQHRRETHPPLRRIVVAVDPPISSHDGADECGLVVVGECEDRQFWVLDDRSEAGLSPAEWARRAVDLYHGWQADSIVAEVNQGGEMVSTVIHSVDEDVPVKRVRATKGKYLRAEPVAAVYAQGRAHHVGNFPILETQLCEMTVDFDRDKAKSSPDRLDALVWGVTELMNGHRTPPTVRRL